MDRWQNLSDIAGWLEDEIGERPAKRETKDDVEALRLTLDSILSDFPEPADPNSDFEAYALHRFAFWAKAALSESVMP